MVDKFTHIKVPILNDEYWVTVCWGECDAEAWRILKTLTDGCADPCDIDGRGAMWAHQGWKYQPVIYICESTTSARFFSTLAHESAHCINALWDKLGERSKEEIFAYSVGAIVYAVEKQVKA
jgi:hypothetical protein